MRYQERRNESCDHGRRGLCIDVWKSRHGILREEPDLGSPGIEAHAFNVKREIAAVLCDRGDVLAIRIRIV